MILYTTYDIILLPVYIIYNIISLYNGHYVMQDEVTALPLGAPGERGGRPRPNMI